MSQAEELLNSLTDEVIPDHTHVMADDDSYFVINPETRKIENYGANRKVIMQHDHNSEIFTFQIPRYVDGHDMTLCNRVKVYYDNIESGTGTTNEDTHDIDDLQVDPNDEDYVICSWRIRREATQLVGSLSFILHYSCIVDGVSVYDFYTDYFTISVNKTKNNGQASLVEYSDILEQWRLKLFGDSSAGVSEIEAKTRESLAAIDTREQEVLDSINNIKFSVTEDGRLEVEY